jgi:glycosidase
MRVFYLFCALFCLNCKKTETPKVVIVDPMPNPEVQYGTPFGQVPSAHAAVIYEVNPRVFSPTRDLVGVTARLDSIKQLGVNVVWLMPTYPTAGIKSVGSPYAIKDYKGVLPAYGTLKDLRVLSDKAHALGMAVMLDWVANHTAWDHPWIQNKSWYTQDASGNIIHPAGTNWQDVADLNFGNSVMRDSMIAAMKYWVLQANIDGFRCDHASGVPSDFWRAAIDTLRQIPNRKLLLFAETEDKALLNVGFDLIFGWPYYTSLKQVFAGQSAKQIFSSHTQEYSGVPTGKHVLRWVTNHDQHAWDATPQTYFTNKKGVMAAFVLASHLNGATMIYNGQEVLVPQKLAFFEGTTNLINWNQNADVLQEYKTVLQYRAQSDALLNGTAQDLSTTDVVAFSKTTASKSVFVIVNVRNSTKVFDLPAILQNKTIKNAHTKVDLQLGATLSLAPFEYFVLENN